MTMLAGGFHDPAPQSAHAFRALLDAMARPGRIHQVSGALPPAPLSVAAGVTEPKQSPLQRLPPHSSMPPAQTPTPSVPLGPS